MGGRGTTISSAPFLLSSSMALLFPDSLLGESYFLSSVRVDFSLVWVYWVSPLCGSWFLVVSFSSALAEAFRLRGEMVLFPARSLPLSNSAVMDPSASGKSWFRRTVSGLGLEVVWEWCGTELCWWRGGGEGGCARRWWWQREAAVAVAVMKGELQAIFKGLSTADSNFFPFSLLLIRWNAVQALTWSNEDLNYAGFGCQIPTSFAILFKEQHSNILAETLVYGR